QGIFNFSTPLQHSSVYLPTVPILAPASPSQGTGSADFNLCDVFKKGNLMPNSHVRKAGTCFSFFIRVFGIKRKTMFSCKPDKRFRMQPTCDLNKFNSLRQSFHKRKKLIPIGCKLENIINSYYLRPFFLDHVKDLLATEHTLMGNFTIF